MGHLLTRVGVDGRPRYTAIYEDAKGKRHSIGTFSSKKEANRKWHDAEAKVAEGRLGDPRRGRMTFRSYVELTWLPNHQIEVTTRERYTSTIKRHLMPEFGQARMIDILPEHVRLWIMQLKGGGMPPATIASCKTILSAIFTTALNDQVIFFHPCRGVRIPPVPVRPRRIITPEQFDVIYRALPDPDSRLLIETDIESGLRWGELTELRPSDLHISTRMLTVSRTAVEVSPQFNPEGGRFLVKEYPKDEEPRRLKLSSQIVRKLEDHISTRELGQDALLFRYVELPVVSECADGVLDLSTLGRTVPNAKGHTYQHGTLTGYNLGSCKCSHCRGAFAAYRTQRRSAGKDDPRTPRRRDTDGHIPRGWFRSSIWRPTLEQAGLELKVRVHDLRHAHASWLLAGGADLQTVKERLGHGSLRTTELYLHTLPDSDESALDALSRIRSRR
jgi:integrase